VKSVACIVVSAVLARHYGWGLVPPELAGVASKMLGALASLVFLALIAMAWRRKAVWLACAYGAWEYGQTAFCSAAYMVKPWPIVPGQPMCSAWVGLDVGFLGLMFAAFVVYRLALAELTVTSDRHG
jgi:hypothetical protein